MNERKQVVTFRASPDQVRRITDAAKRAGVTKTELILQRVLGPDEPPRHTGKAYRPCRHHPEAGAILVGRRWMCKHPGCPEVLS